MKFDIDKELKSNDIILIVMPSSGYHEISAEVVNKLSESPTCYVTFNKTADALQEDFKANKTKSSNTIILDGITKTFRDKVPDSDSVYYISSPSAFTEISLTISKFIKYGFEYLIFDNITNLIVYSGSSNITKFISNLITKIRAQKVKTVFYALNIKEHEGLIKQFESFVDKVIRIE